MPSVITIQGPKVKGKGKSKDEKPCKTVTRKNGCSIQQCLVETPKGPRWLFQKGTTRCPSRR